MKIKVIYADRETRIELSSKSTVLDLLGKLNINPETVLTKRDNEIVADFEELNDKDSIEILKVVSGG